MDLSDIRERWRKHVCIRELRLVGCGITVSDAAPTVAIAAAATPATIAGTTTALSVLGADDGGESNLTYTWAVTAKPGGATNPTFSANGTNGSKAATATFSSISATKKTAALRST